MTPAPYTPGRDARFPHAGDAIEHIEARSCVLGCVHAGSAEDVAEFGPGGTCSVLASIYVELGPVNEIQDDG